MAMLSPIAPNFSQKQRESQKQKAKPSHHPTRYAAGGRQKAMNSCFAKLFEANEQTNNKTLKATLGNAHAHERLMSRAAGMQSKAQRHTSTCD
jgi:hypothetical protein